jgi:uncharacterized protein (DUF362 family)
MKRLTRRELLLYMGAGFSTVFLNQLLAACGEKPVPTNPPPATQVQPKPIPTSAAAVGQAPEPTSAPVVQPTTAASPTPPGIPDIAVARGGEPEDLVRRAIKAMGGMEKYVPKGANVIVKPNICVAYNTYEYAATTNPWVVGTLVKLALEAGAASVKVMDFPFGGTAVEAYKKSGIEEQVKAAGGEMVYMRSINYVTTEIPGAVSLNKTDIYKDILNTDVLINVPVAKDHELSTLTLGMKNLMGVVSYREELHWDLGNCLTDLNSRVHSTLTVIDAVRIMTQYGPTGGSLDYVKKLDTLIVSTDVVAADAYATTLFNMKPKDLPSVVVATQRKLGRSDLENMRIEEIPVGS